MSLARSMTRLRLALPLLLVPLLTAAPTTVLHGSASLQGPVLLVA